MRDPRHHVGIGRNLYEPFERYVYKASSQCELFIVRILSKAVSSSSIRTILILLLLFFYYTNGIYIIHIGRINLLNHGAML